MWQTGVPLSNFTSWRVGGAAEFLALPRSVLELQAILERGQGLPLTFLGAGSNLLVSDRGIPGLVICTKYLRGVRWTADRVYVGAGEPLPKLAWQLAKRGWAGLEWAVGIPGTAGGMAVMNAGAQGGCAADCVVGVEVWTTAGQRQWLAREDLQYSYRHSVLQGGNAIVTEVVLQLQPGHDPQSVLARTRQNYEHRHRTQPYHLPSCGSVFRNPPNYAAGWLIDRCGLKGYQLGQAQVSELHANFILNLGGAKAREIYELMETIKLKVWEQWSILLQPEVKMIGDFSY
ncbi:MAG: UDP-N-acetylmuramate dehydrogenase [Pseudanabaenaceae cyanobacterium SKYGB_i_bin29]|nr:UDP-N-acetylmuramate dehydrogenase [Pseudanabaenaceae cyanobacterium SKYG29]MDW8420871.1 UDP-N-acetylmuramate dehydrogenase [Pseudanabaenaceae cyanobacterium SKYGB_i_bin29]